MPKQYYIASCVYSTQFPERSQKIQNYIRERFGMEIVRCCVPSYKLQFFSEKMPEGEHRNRWVSLPDSGQFLPGDSVYSLCHNCNNIIEETHPGVETRSLWELIDSDERFPYPDHTGLKVYVQDCWRSRDRSSEQAAVRNLLTKMGIEWEETAQNHWGTDFCGVSLYRAQPPRNPKLAPKHYVEGAAGKFVPHTPEEQQTIMKTYCAKFQDQEVVCYCHYCLEGLRIGGANARHLADLLFP